MDPLDRKGLFFVVDWDTRTLGVRHDKLRGAVQEYDTTIKSKKSSEEYHVAVAELVYPFGENGLPLFASIRRQATIPPIREK